MPEITNLSEHIRQISIIELRLPVRIHNALRRASINTIGELVILANTGLRKIHGVGSTTYHDIVDILNVFMNAVDSNGDVDWQSYFLERNIKLDVTVQDILIARDIELPNDIKGLSLGNLHLPTHTYNVLTRSNISTIGELLVNVNSNPYMFHGLGNDSSDMIKDNLLTLGQSITSEGNVDWIQYCNYQNIVIIPQHYKLGSSPIQLLQQLPELFKEIFVQYGDDRQWRIIQCRFELNNMEKLTFEELGKVFGITRERVRQLERKAFSELRNAIIENQYSGCSYRVNPEITRSIQSLFDALVARTKEFILEADLFELIQQELGTDVSKLRPILVMLFTMFGMTRIEFDTPALMPVWGRGVSRQHELIQNVIPRLDHLLTRDIAVPMKESDILRIINQGLSKQKKLTLLQFRIFIELCSTIEQRDDGLFWGKFEYLENRGHQAERLLIEAGEPLSTRELTRVINSKLVVHGHHKLTERNLANQLGCDVRFVPIGRSGYWGLQTWDHINTSTVLHLMEQYLLIRKSSATPEEIFKYVDALRPVSEGSITFYLRSQPNRFKKADRTHWGLASWAETQNAVTWSREQVAAFVATLFEKHKVQELEFKVIQEALMQVADVTMPQATGLLANNPVIAIHKRPNSKDRFAVLQTDYQDKLIAPGRQFPRKTATQRERVEEIVRTQLAAVPGYQMPLSELLSLLHSKHGVAKKTAYAYLHRAEFLETLPMPGTRTKICRLKEKHGLSLLSLTRSS